MSNKLNLVLLSILRQFQSFVQILSSNHEKKTKHFEKKIVFFFLIFLLRNQFNLFLFDAAKFSFFFEVVESSLNLREATSKIKRKF